MALKRAGILRLATLKYNLLLPKPQEAPECPKCQAKMERRRSKRFTLFFGDVAIIQNVMEGYLINFKLCKSLYQEYSTEFHLSGLPYHQCIVE